MNVALVSTYAPQRCGIAGYTRQLAQALAADVPALTPVVLSEFGACDGVDGRVRSIPTFRRDADYGAAIADAADRTHATVVHVQHAPDIFGTDDRFLRLLEMLRQRHIAPVVTLHTVHSLGTGAWRGYFNVPSFHRRLGELAAAVMVHGEARCAETLRAHGVPADRVKVIPFGTPESAPLDRAIARAQLGLHADDPLLVSVGFLRRAKRLETLIRALHYVRRRVPACRLILAGAVQGDSWRERWYPRYLRALVRAFGLTGAVEVRERFLSDEENVLLHAAADLVLLPYGQRYGSASMALHTAVAARRLPICSRIPKFEEVAQSLSPDLLVPPGNARAWAAAIERWLEQAHDPATEQRLARFARITSWSRVAEQHAAMYAALTA